MSDPRYWYLWCVVAIALYGATLWLLVLLMQLLNAFYGCIVCTQ